uniref:Uncharacterized protein n=1 Tax=Oryza punctata TaxID=4537 RepID=A0A0E0JRE2_ORYPU
MQGAKTLPPILHGTMKEQRGQGQAPSRGCVKNGRKTFAGSTKYLCSFTCFMLQDPVVFPSLRQASCTPALFGFCMHMCGSVGLAPIIRIVRLSVPSGLQGSDELSVDSGLKIAPFWLSDEPMHTWIIKKSWVRRYEDSTYSFFLDNENPSLRKRIL